MSGLIVKSAAAAFMKKNGLRTSTSFYDSLDKAVEALLEAAVKRAKANKRQTVMAQDV